MRWTLTAISSAMMAMAFGLVGCGESDRGFKEVPKGAIVKDAPHEHEHGPHGGHLVELGNEEYHAEVVFDPKAAKVTVYVLDSNAQKSVPIASKEVALKLAIEGKPKPFVATAAPQSDDPKGQSSRFELAGNADIKAHVKDEEDLKGQVIAAIGGKEFSGEISHDHVH